jgi:hypothetical protein
MVNDKFITIPYDIWEAEYKDPVELNRALHEQLQKERRDYQERQRYEKDAMYKAFIEEHKLFCSETDIPGSYTRYWYSQTVADFVNKELKKIPKWIRSLFGIKFLNEKQKPYGGAQL